VYNIKEETVKLFGGNINLDDNEIANVNRLEGVI
jgi:hypothetical protein